MDLYVDRVCLCFSSPSSPPLSSSSLSSLSSALFSYSPNKQQIIHSPSSSSSYARLLSSVSLCTSLPSPPLLLWLIDCVLIPAVRCSPSLFLLGKIGREVGESKKRKRNELGELEEDNTDSIITHTSSNVSSDSFHSVVFVLLHLLQLEMELFSSSSGSSAHTNVLMQIIRAFALVYPSCLSVLSTTRDLRGELSSSLLTFKSTLLSSNPSILTKSLLFSTKSERVRNQIFHCLSVILIANTSKGRASSSSSLSSSSFLSSLSDTWESDYFPGVPPFNCSALENQSNESLNYLDLQQEAHFIMHHLCTPLTNIGASSSSPSDLHSLYSLNNYSFSLHCIVNIAKCRVALAFPSSVAVLMAITEYISSIRQEEEDDPSSVSTHTLYSLYPVSLASSAPSWAPSVTRHVESIRMNCLQLIKSFYTYNWKKCLSQLSPDIHHRMSEYLDEIFSFLTAGGAGSLAQEEKTFVQKLIQEKKEKKATQTTQLVAGDFLHVNHVEALESKEFHSSYSEFLSVPLSPSSIAELVIQTLIHTFKPPSHLSSSHSSNQQSISPLFVHFLAAAQNIRIEKQTDRKEDATMSEEKTSSALPSSSPSILSPVDLLLSSPSLSSSSASMFYRSSCSRLLSNSLESSLIASGAKENLHLRASIITKLICSQVLNQPLHHQIQLNTQQIQFLHENLSSSADSMISFSSFFLPGSVVYISSLLSSPSHQSLLSHIASNFPQRYSFCVDYLYSLVTLTPSQIKISAVTKIIKGMEGTDGGEKQQTEDLSPEEEEEEELRKLQKQQTYLLQQQDENIHTKEETQEKEGNKENTGMRKKEEEGEQNEEKTINVADSAFFSPVSLSSSVSALVHRYLSVHPSFLSVFQRGGMPQSVRLFQEFLSSSHLILPQVYINSSFSLEYLWTVQFILDSVVASVSSDLNSSPAYLASFKQFLLAMPIVPLQLLVPFFLSSIKSSSSSLREFVLSSLCHFIMHLIDPDVSSFLVRAYLHCMYSEEFIPIHSILCSSLVELLYFPQSQSKSFSSPVCFLIRSCAESHLSRLGESDLLDDLPLIPVSVIIPPEPVYEDIQVHLSDADDESFSSLSADERKRLEITRLIALAELKQKEYQRLMTRREFLLEEKKKVERMSEERKKRREERIQLECLLFLKLFSFDLKRNLSLFCSAYIQSMESVRVLLHEQLNQMIQQMIFSSNNQLSSTVEERFSLLLESFSSTPLPSQPLILHLLSLLFDQASSASQTSHVQQLVHTALSLYKERHLDCRFLIPVITSLSEEDIRLCLPRLISLPPQHVKTAFNKIFSAKPMPIQAHVLLIQLHLIQTQKKGKAASSTSSDDSTDNLIMKRVCSAMDLCFSHPFIYTDQVLQMSLSALIQLNPLPRLLIRSLSQSISLYSATKPSFRLFCLEFLAKLLNRKVFERTFLFDGWIKCCAQLMPQSVQLLFLLPDNAFNAVLQSKEFGAKEELIQTMQLFVQAQESRPMNQRMNINIQKKQMIINIERKQKESENNQ